MKRTYIKKVLGEVFKTMDQKGYKNCEVMELTMKTCINRKAEMFVSVEAIIQEQGADGKSYKLETCCDL